MDVLKGKDLITLSIFRCKICSGRLHSPVFKVGDFGNICARCYEKSAYVDVTEYFEIETILSELDVSCNYAEAGCTYKGPYHKTCDHEERCCFRKRPCPFTYLSQCDFEFVHRKDIIQHISEEHLKNILAVENGCVDVENPTASESEAMYFLEIDQIGILLRVKVSVEKRLVYYSFYHFGDLQGRHINLSSSAFEKCEKNDKVVHESEITRKLDKSRAYKVKFSTLKHLGCFEKINICLNFELKVGESGYDEECAKNVAYSRCLQCNEYVTDLWWCFGCYSRGCTKCKQNLTIGQICQYTSCRKPTFIYVNFSDAGIILRIPCKNEGCSQIVKSHVYKLHCNYQCLFKMHRCFAEHCEFQGFTYDFVEHIFSKHQFENTKQFSLQRNTSCTRLFSNGSDTFLHKCLITNKNELIVECVKLTEPFRDDSCVWIVDIIYRSRRPLTVRGDYSLGGWTRTLAVGEYIDKDLLSLETNVKRI